MPTGSSGGAAGPLDDPLGPSEVEPRHVHLGGGFVEGGMDGGVAGVIGVAGTDAMMIELKVDGETPIRQSVQAALRWFVVCFEPGDRGTISVPRQP